MSKCILEGKNNSVILNYDEGSENLFKWYQQLTAESLGKKNKGVFRSYHLCRKIITVYCNYT